MRSPKTVRPVSRDLSVEMPVKATAQSVSRCMRLITRLLVISLVMLVMVVPALAQGSSAWDNTSLRLGLVGAQHSSNAADQKLNTRPWRLGGLGVFPMGKAEISLREETEKVPGVTAGLTAFYFSEQERSASPKLRMLYMGPSMGVSKYLSNHLGLFADLSLGYRRMSFHSFLGNDVTHDLAFSHTVGIGLSGGGQFALKIGFFGCGVVGVGTDYAAGLSIELELMRWKTDL